MKYNSREPRIKYKKALENWNNLLNIKVEGCLKQKHLKIE